MGKSGFYRGCFFFSGVFFGMTLARGARDKGWRDAIFWFGWKGNWFALRRLSPRHTRPGAIIASQPRAHTCATILRARNDVAPFLHFMSGVGMLAGVWKDLFWSGIYCFVVGCILKWAGRGARADKGWGVCDFLGCWEGELFCSPGAVTPSHASGGDHRVAAASAYLRYDPTRTEW